MPVLYARIPEDRLGVLIGPEGRTKRWISEATGTTVEIDPEDSGVRLVGPATDPTSVLKARDLVLAIGRGFSPERARRLLREDTFLSVLDIKLETGRREKSALRRIRARVIGSGGRARARLEELSGCSVSVYGSTVALIGTGEQLDRGTRAIELLLRGSEHATVFHLLARLRRDAAVEEATSPEEAGDEPDGGE